MQYADHIAIRAHTDAIQTWVAADAMSSANALEVAYWVALARSRSAFAMLHTFRPLTPAIVVGVEAACQDAEVEAAIEHHAAAIVILSRPE